MKASAPPSPPVYLMNKAKRRILAGSFVLSPAGYRDYYAPAVQVYKLSCTYRLRSWVVSKEKHRLGSFTNQPTFYCNQDDINTKYSQYLCRISSEVLCTLIMKIGSHLRGVILRAIVGGQKV